MTTTTIYGREVKPEVGSVIRFDGQYVGRRLLEGDDYVDSGFPGCAFRLESAIGYHIAVNVTVTGRTFQRFNDSLWVRVRVEFVGDCEPSTFTRAWMLVN